MRFAPFSRIAATLLLGAMLAAGLALPALAAQPITANGGTCATSPGTPVWTNGTQTINVGDTVNWMNCGATGNHFLVSTSKGWCLDQGQSTGASNTAWSYSCRFMSPGQFTFVCGVHSSMTGSITVTGLSSPPPPPPPPPATPTSTHTPAPAVSHAMNSSSTPRPAAPSPTPSEIATTPAPTPSDSSPEPPSPSASAPVPASSSGPGRGGPNLVPVLAVVVLVAIAGGVGFVLRRG